MQKNSLIRKIRLISKFMTSQPGKQTIAIHILPNISRSRSNQTMKFCQLIEYNMRNIFLKNNSQNVVEKLFPDPFLKSQNWAYFWINNFKVLYSFFFNVCQVEGYQNILKLSCTSLAFTSYEAFLQNKKRSGTRLPVSFSKWYFSCSILLTDQISLSVCLYFVRYRAIYVL